MTTFPSASEALRFATNFLWTNSGVAKDEPDDIRRAVLRHEAETLLMWCTGWSRTQLITQLVQTTASREWSELFTGERESQLRQALASRANGVPLQYLVGEADFYGRSFRVAPGCLIPRPETEGLVEAVLRWMAASWTPSATLSSTIANGGIEGRGQSPLASAARDSGKGPVILDVGTGSGAIAITLALEYPKAEVHSVDISDAALAVAAQNVQQLQAAVTLHHEDGLDLLASGHLPLNLLVSNPPYIPSAEVDELEVEVRHHEPRTALDGGTDGLDMYRRFAELGDGIFLPGPAALFFEVGAGQAHLVEQLFQSSGFWMTWTFRSIPDLRGINRVVVGERQHNR